MTSVAAGALAALYKVRQSCAARRGGSLAAHRAAAFRHGVASRAADSRRIVPFHRRFLPHVREWIAVRLFNPGSMDPAPYSRAGQARQALTQWVARCVA